MFFAQVARNQMRSILQTSGSSVNHDPTLDTRICNETEELAQLYMSWFDGTVWGRETNDDKCIARRNSLFQKIVTKKGVIKDLIGKRNDLDKTCTVVEATIVDFFADLKKDPLGEFKYPFPPCDCKV